MRRPIKPLEQTAPDLDSFSDDPLPANAPSGSGTQATRARPGNDAPSPTPSSGVAASLLVIYGTDEDDEIGGTSGNDNILGFGGNDTIYGNGGDDNVFGGTGNDTIDGLNGNDQLFSEDGNDVLAGGFGNDTLSGGAGINFLYGERGTDLLLGGSGVDSFDGGLGYDTVSYSEAGRYVAINLTMPSASWGGDARDDSFISIEAFVLSPYNDDFVAAGTAATVSGGDGWDDLVGGSGDDILSGDGGLDFLFGGDGNDTLNGGDDADYLVGRDSADVLDGGNDSDVLDGGAGADSLAGGEGIDTASYLDAEAGVSIDLTKTSSTWTGDAKDDAFTSIEWISLSNFADTFRGDANANVVFALDENDQIFGLEGDDWLYAGHGNDDIFGDSGDDFLTGDRGNDRMFGGTERDTLEGGLGGDFLVGNQGADTFRYTALAQSQNVMIDGVSQLDQIADFAQGQDKIDLSHIDANGTLAGNQAFVFIADPAHYTGDWTGAVWQTTNPQNGIATINVSVDGDADAEMQIDMSHPYQFTANDFIL